MPVLAPVKASLSMPVSTPVQASVKALVLNPVQVPVPTTVQEPVKAPVLSPLQVPVRVRVQGPVKASVSIPVSTPVQAPVPIVSVQDKALEAERRHLIKTFGLTNLTTTAGEWVDTDAGTSIFIKHFPGPFIRKFYTTPSGGEYVYVDQWKF